MWLRWKSSVVRTWRWTCVGGDVALFVGDAEGGEAEAGGGDGGGGALVAVAGGAAVDGAVEDLAGFGVGLLGEVEAAALLHFHEEGVVFGGEAFGRDHVVLVGVGLSSVSSVGCWRLGWALRELWRGNVLVLREGGWSRPRTRRGALNSQ